MRIARLSAIFLSVAMLVLMSGCSHESRDWQAAQSANTIEAYEAFVTEHPKSAHLGDAQARVEQLTEDRDWQRASTTDTVDAYRQFLAAHPQAKSAQEARIRIENFGLNGGAAAPAAPAAQAFAAGPAMAPVSPAPPSTSHPQQEQAHAYRVQLGAFSTQAKAERQWHKLTAHYGKELHGLEPDIERGKGAKGRHVFRLKAQLPSEAKARALCAQLQKRGQACVVAKH
ncbi:MAG TPA: SPOR domain-containing protein [Steroidobacteraceae bacterium]